MNSKHNLGTFATRLLGGAALGAVLSTGAFAQPAENELVVTAQRQEQSIQDVPIAVSAFSSQDLQDRQLETFQDIQFNIPNFAYTKNQFTSSTIVLRGIGALAIGASTEPSVSVHLNDLFLSSPRLFESEFFDVERLEVLRGPQGTLFGRNATGGAINVITNKAQTDKVGGYVDAEYGNFDAAKIQGALNLPLTDRLAFRIAGTTIQRGGYTTNEFDNSKVDDRNVYSLRASTRWLPTNNTTIDFIASYLKENDSRLRSQKQACEQGPLSPLLGCDPNGPRRFDQQDLRASFLANASQQTLGALFGAPTAAFGLVSLNAPILGQQQPAGVRQIIHDTRPQYNAEESIFEVNAKHDFEKFSIKFDGGYGNSKVASREDFDAGVGPVLNRPAAVCAPLAFGGLPAICNFTGGPGAASFPLSNFDVGITGPSNGLVGSIGGNNQSRSANYQSADLSIGETDYWSVETIINSDFDGRFNFLLGSRHDRSNGFADYGVAATSLDYFSALGGTLAAVGGGVPNAANTGFGLYVPYFYNDTDDSFLRSTSAFGEIYVDLTSKLKFTGGIRHNFDTKGVRDRGNLLDSFGGLVAGTLPPALAIVPFGTQSVRPLLDPNELVQGTTGAVNDFRVAQSQFNSTTGRAVLQYTPSENVQIYTSWTRGFKAGGFNPRATTAGLPLTFDPEVINAFELGVKSNLFGGLLQANATGFYYRYSGLQVGRTVGNTAINDNVDARVWGLEGEFAVHPTRNLVGYLNASYLNTTVKNFSTFDPRNPTAGDPNAELVRDLITSTNCVITRNPGAAPLLLQNGGSLLAGPFAPLNALIGGIAGVPGVGAYSFCSQLASNIGAINLATGGTRGYAVSAGVAPDLSGNELPGAPTFKVSAGLQYTFDIGGWEVVPRADAFYQNRFFGSIFNTEQDRIDGYAYANAQIKIAPQNSQWSARFFVQNLSNSEAITGTFDIGQGGGNFQNLFYLEPRRWGFGVNYAF